MIELLKHQISIAKYGNRSFTATILKSIRDNDKQDLVAQKIIDTLAYCVRDAKPLSATAAKLTRTLAATLNIRNDLPKEQGIYKSGMNILDWCTKAGLIVPVMMPSRNKKGIICDTWHIQAINQFADYVYTEDKQYIDPRVKYDGWVSPHRFIGNSRICIVKRADQFQMANLYTQEKMPLVYDALNSLEDTEWEINDDLLVFANEADEFNSFAPTAISKEQRKAAIGQLNRLSYFAASLEAKKFKQWCEWFDDNVDDIEPDTANQIASKKSQQYAEDYLQEKSEPFTDIVSNWSKWFAYDKILGFANEWSGSTLNFPHNLDSRGRIYALTPWLNPQSEDIAKALLRFKKAYPVNKWVMAIDTANKAGVDKLTFDGRIDWVEQNLDTIIKIGRNPLANFDILNDLVGSEKKTRWQFVAMCIEWARYEDHTNIHGENGFTTQIPMGLDSTSSGNQILGMIARDHEVAPYVNITKTTNDAPGDLYQYVGTEFAYENILEIENKSEALEELCKLSPKAKVWRKLTKRICMCVPYSATKRGAQNMTWEDRRDHSDLTAKLNRRDCKSIGNILYDACYDSAKRSMDIMKYLQEGIAHHEDGAIIKWVVPYTGFTAFQVKDRSGETRVTDIIGDTKVTIKVLYFKNIPNRAKHRSAISPDIVHSLDAAMLVLIITGLPKDISVGAVHDQFMVPQGNFEDLQNVARDAYITISNRDKFKTMCDNAFGIERDLPIAGEWTPEQLYTTEYFIC